MSQPYIHVSAVLSGVSRVSPVSHQYFPAGVKHTSHSPMFPVQPYDRLVDNFPFFNYILFPEEYKRHFLLEKITEFSDWNDL